MKRRFLILLAVCGAVGAFGASSALADNATIKFDQQTGVLTYETFVNNATVNENDVQVTPNHTQIAGYTVGLTDNKWVHEWTSPNMVHVTLDAGAQASCFWDDGNSLSCPAKKVVVKTGRGNDMISVAWNLKVPTVLEGGAGMDIIYGGGGNDVIWGGCSNDPTCGTSPDSLHGGDGNDVLHGGDSGGYDYLAGDAGDDVLDGGLGKDNLYGGDGHDTADYSSRTAPVTGSLNGLADDGQAGENDNIGSDVEVIQGGSGNDTLYAGFLPPTPQTLKGGPGNDSLIGYSGNELLMGEAGNDQLRPGTGADNVYGGDGQDTVSYAERTNPVAVTLDGLANDGEAGESDNVTPDVENVTGGSGNDTLIGNGNANVLSGGAGNDALDGKGGQPDTLLGGPGMDKLDGGPAGSAFDTLDGGPDTDVVTYASRTDDLTIMLNSPTGQEDKILNVENALGGSGNDKIVGNDGPNALFGNGGNDGIQGNGGNDSLYGGPGNDTIWGNAGNDTIAGSTGNDTISGGTGADWISGWDGIDTVSYADATAPVTVSLDGTANDGAAGEGDNVLSGVEIVYGGPKSDTLIGDNLPNWLYGGAGNDKLLGLGGDDMLDGQTGTDTLDGGAATDACFGETKANCEK